MSAITPFTYGTHVVVSINKEFKDCIVVHDASLVASMPVYDVVFDKGMARLTRNKDKSSDLIWVASNIRLFCDMQITKRSYEYSLLTARLIEASKCRKLTSLELSEGIHHA